jgi:hypothetical protein
VAGLRGAISDLAETIRRVFQPPPCHQAPLDCGHPGQRAMEPLAARILQPFQPLAGRAERMQLLAGCGVGSETFAWTPPVRGEAGLADWDAGAQVAVLPTFRADRCARLEVPALPRRAAVLREVPGLPAARARRGWDRAPAPAVRQAVPELPRPRCFRALEAVLGLPLAIAGENLERISKGLLMRYSLQLVRATGENIRNLEVLGIYRIPRKGTRQIHHDPASGRLQVTLGPEAAGARRTPFILARRKTDNEIVCCFVEEN